MFIPHLFLVGVWGSESPDWKHATSLYKTNIKITLLFHSVEVLFSSESTILENNLSLQRVVNALLALSFYCLHYLPVLTMFIYHVYLLPV